MTIKNTKIGFIGVVVMILTACLGIRWIPVAGSIGHSAVIFWALGALVFFIPLSLLVMELSSHFKEDGGVYLWVRQSLGDELGFFAAWFYWVNNLFFYPGLLVFMAANFAYFIGGGGLAENHLLIEAMVLTTLWIAILINVMGIQLMAKIASFACAVNLLLGAFIIIGGFHYWLGYHVNATAFTWASFMPGNNVMQNLSNLTLLMFALSGIELIPTMAASIQNSKRTLARALAASGITILLTYIAGTLAINMVLSPHELNNTTGLMEALMAVANKMHAPRLAGTLVFSLLVVEFSALIVWLIAPTIMFFECIPHGILPKWMQRLNHRQVPANALYLIGLIVTLLMLMTAYLPTVNSIFTTLVLMGTVVYFLPYLLLSAGYIKLRRKQTIQHPLMPAFCGYLCAILLFLSVLLGIILSFFPSADIKTQFDLIIYETELAFGPLLFIGAGYLLYHRSGRVS